MRLDQQRQALCYVLHMVDKTALKILPLLRDLNEKIHDRKLLRGFTCNTVWKWTHIKYDSDSMLKTGKGSIRGGGEFPVEKSTPKHIRKKNGWKSNQSNLTFSTTCKISNGGKEMCPIASDSWPGSLLLFNVMTWIDSGLLAVSSLNGHLKIKTKVYYSVPSLRWPCHQLCLCCYSIKGGHTHQLSLLHLKPAWDAWETLYQCQRCSLHPQALQKQITHSLVLSFCLKGYEKKNPSILIPDVHTNSISGRRHTI